MACTFFGPYQFYSFCFEWYEIIYGPTAPIFSALAKGWCAPLLVPRQISDFVEDGASATSVDATLARSCRLGLTITNELSGMNIRVWSLRLKSYDSPIQDAGDALTNSDTRFTATGASIEDAAT
jgi:hypothetical protein